MTQDSKKNPKGQFLTQRVVNLFLILYEQFKVYKLLLHFYLTKLHLSSKFFS